MPKIAAFREWMVVALCSWPIVSCGVSSEQTSRILGGEKVPCGTDNGVPKTCGTDRSVDYEVRFDNLMRYTQCGQSSVTAYPFFDQTKPFMVSSCGAGSGRFFSFGPFLTMPESGWINAKVHLWICPVSDMSMPVDTFALDIYSASTGGILKRDVYNYSSYKFTKKNEFGGEIWDFAGTSSSLAAKMSMTAGRWVEVPISAPLDINAPIGDLEVRVQPLGNCIVGALGVDITYTRHP